jgi:hypothetical protein
MIALAAAEEGLSTVKKKVLPRLGHIQQRQQMMNTLGKIDIPFSPSRHTDSTPHFGPSNLSTLLSENAHVQSTAKRLVEIAVVNGSSEIVLRRARGELSAAKLQMMKANVSATDAGKRWRAAKASLTNAMRALKQAHDKAASLQQVSSRLAAKTSALKLKVSVAARELQQEQTLRLKISKNIKKLDTQCNLLKQQAENMTQKTEHIQIRAEEEQRSKEHWEREVGKFEAKLSFQVADKASAKNSATHREAQLLRARQSKARIEAKLWLKKLVKARDRAKSAQYRAISMCTRHKKAIEDAKRAKRTAEDTDLTQQNLAAAGKNVVVLKSQSQFFNKQAAKSKKKETSTAAAVTIYQKNFRISDNRHSVAKVALYEAWQVYQAAHSKARLTERRQKHYRKESKVKNVMQIRQELKQLISMYPH